MSTVEKDVELIDTVFRLKNITCRPEDVRAIVEVGKALHIFTSFREAPIQIPLNLIDNMQLEDVTNILLEAEMAKSKYVSQISEAEGRRVAQKIQNMLNKEWANSEGVEIESLDVECIDGGGGTDIH